jgi:hypothetical protein
MSLRVIWQYMDHIIFFGWRTGPYNAIWPSVPWTICYLHNFLSYRGSRYYSKVICLRCLTSLLIISYQWVLLVEENAIRWHCMTSATDGAGTANTSSSLPVFSGIRVALSFVVCVMFCRSCVTSGHMAVYGPYTIFWVTDRSIYYHMTLSTMNYLLYIYIFSQRQIGKINK